MQLEEKLERKIRDGLKVFEGIMPKKVFTNQGELLFSLTDFISWQTLWIIYCLRDLITKKVFFFLSFFFFFTSWSRIVRPRLGENPSQEIAILELSPLRVLYLGLHVTYMGLHYTRSPGFFKIILVYFFHSLRAAPTEALCCLRHKQSLSEQVLFACEAHQNFLWIHSEQESNKPKMRNYMSHCIYLRSHEKLMSVVLEKGECYFKQ